jgi:hypothetical protein
MIVKLRRSVKAFSAMVAGVIAVAGLVVTPAAAAATNAPAPAACSTDIINAFGGSLTGRRISFAYLLAGPSCRDGVYLLVVRNLYNPRQTALLARRGDGSSNLIHFDQALPFTPTGVPTTLFGGTGAGLCVTGITVRRARIDDIAPDPYPGQNTCISLIPSGPGGVARAFH